MTEHDIEPVWKEGIFQPPPLSDKRPELIAAVLTFVHRAAGLEGVRRVSLFGQLATDKPHPENTEVLVEIEEGLPLAPLARISRQFQSNIMETGDSRGGCVFLADPEGRYLGRVCPWRECRPGIRQACQAQHCGAIEYLHDDFQNVNLSRDFIAGPPIDLWPETVVRIDPVPEDVRNALRERLEN